MYQSYAYSTQQYEFWAALEVLTVCLGEVCEKLIFFGFLPSGVLRVFRQVWFYWGCEWAVNHNDVETSSVTWRDVTAISLILLLKVLTWLFWKKSDMQLLLPENSSKLWFFSTSSDSLSFLCVANMREKLSRYFAAEEKLVRGQSGWTSAAVAVLLLGLFASCCWAEEASCHGAYDLYFVLDK